MKSDRAADLHLVREKGKRPLPKVDVYPDRKGEFRWRLKAANGRTIADSGEGYTRKGSARRAVTRFIEAAERLGHARMFARIRARG